MMLECYNGKLHYAVRHRLCLVFLPPSWLRQRLRLADSQGSTGEHYKTAKETICKVHQNDLVRIELDMDKGEMAYKVNDKDYGVCFKNIKGTIYPAVSFYSTAGKTPPSPCVTPLPWWLRQCCC